MREILPGSECSRGQLVDPIPIPLLFVTPVIAPPSVASSSRCNSLSAEPVGVDTPHAVIVWGGRGCQREALPPPASASWQNLLFRLSGSRSLGFGTISTLL